MFNPNQDMKYLEDIACCGWIRILSSRFLSRCLTRQHSEWVSTRKHVIFCLLYRHRGNTRSSISCTNLLFVESTCDALIGSFSVWILQYGPFPWKPSNPFIFVLERSRQIQNLQPKQRKESVNIVILHIETTRRS